MTSDQAIHAPLAAFRRDLQKVLKNLEGKRMHIHVPPETGMRRKRERSHFHATTELLIQLGGATDFVCPGQSFRVSAGHCCVMPRGVPHAETPVDLDSPYALLVCMHSPQGMRLHRARCDPTRRIQGYGTYHLEHPLARDAFRHLDALTTPGRMICESRRDAYRRALLEAFLVTTLSLLENQASPESPPTDHSPLVRAAEHNVQTHLGDPDLRVTGIAQAIGCSADHLSRQFRKAHDQSLQSWILKQRIDYACDLLRNSRFNITEIGWACGFNDASYFVQTFRKIQGVTPRHYRQAEAANPGA